jgi:hypothetical protein
MSKWAMRHLLIIISCLAVAFMATNALAGVATGTIQVTVNAKEGAVIKGARVEAESPDTPVKRSGSTDEDGVVLLLALDPAVNYTVSVIFPGFNGARNDNVLVRSGERTDLHIELTPSTATESITVTSETPLVDVTTAIAGQSIGLELTESLPTRRTYQDYLQLVPGVLPSDPDNPGNPASRSGMNYADIRGELGISTDNVYYIEGINVTDNITGTFGANMNTEIIQEQKVITGGIPAEYPGAAGLLSNVVTKFGGNQWSGSLNYFFQNDSLRATNENAPEDSFDTSDAALTIGGPIYPDKAWFFLSYRNFNREDSVTALDTNQPLRTVENDQDQYYGKVTWQPSLNDRITLTYLGDPTTISGRTDRDILNTRDFAREQGGDRWTASYQRVFGNGVLDFSYQEHNGELTDNAADATLIRNDVLFEQNQVNTLSQQQLGGEGNLDIDERDNSSIRLSTEWFFDSSWGHHTLKGGIEFIENINFRDRNFTDGGTGQQQQIQSLDDNMLAHCQVNGCVGFTGAIDAQFINDGNFSGGKEFTVGNTSDLNGLIITMENFGPMGTNPDTDLYFAYLTLFDTSGNGSIGFEDTNFGAGIVFNSTLDNPDPNVINYNRDLQSAVGPQETTSEGSVFYLQDTWQLGKWTTNLGVRGERWEHFATTGAEIYDFGWEYAPRLSLIYDIKGDGRQKVSGYYGRYYDPIRNNMTNFAGTLTGRITEEQVFIAAPGIDRYTTFRTRGGPVVQDAFFAPTTKTPFTDEWTLGYQRDLGRSMSIEGNLIKRKTRDLLEDYDLSLYARQIDGTSIYPAELANQGDQVSVRLLDENDPIQDPDSLFLNLGYFGYTVNPGSNFVIATLAGGQRSWEGAELIFRKRYTDRWQGLVSYSYARADGNSNSDSNADFQGDVLFLDPRAPNQQGRQPGLIRNLVKAAGAYRWNNGMQVGATWVWNSGTVASRTFEASRRHLPDTVDPGEEFEFAGINPGCLPGQNTCTNPAGATEAWIAPGNVGGLTNPSWSSLDLRVQYNHRWGKINGEFFVDLFNALNEQDPIRNLDLSAGQGLDSFGDPIQWNPPQRFFLGARVSY